MPKEVITKSTLPKVQRKLNRWEGELTSPLFFRSSGEGAGDQVGSPAHDVPECCLASDRWDCMTCKDVWVKCDPVSLERIQRLEEQTAKLVEMVQRAHADGTLGAEPWVDIYKERLAHVHAMRLAMESPDISDGVVPRMPVGHDP